MCKFNNIITCNCGLSEYADSEFEFVENKLQLNARSVVQCLLWLRFQYPDKNMFELSSFSMLS